ncbi:unnamed protein product [Linum trigynum]|uniref:Uncharacterized protein n=1 Tax=Linum trigynum TaxID=586398 RepID=A0AAV2FUM3_9ROSI
MDVYSLQCSVFQSNLSQIVGQDTTMVLIYIYIISRKQIVSILLYHLVKCSVAVFNSKLCLKVVIGLRNVCLCISP